jgi:hypothetical protein
MIDTAVLQGILTPKQRDMGFRLSEDDHAVMLKYGALVLTTWSAAEVTFLTIQKEANNREAELRCPKAVMG